MTASFIVEQTMLAVCLPARTTQFVNLVSQTKDIAAYVPRDLQAMTVELMLMSVIISPTAVSMLSVTILLDLTTVLVRKDILETDTLAKNLNSPSIHRYCHTMKITSAFSPGSLFQPLEMFLIGCCVIVLHVTELQPRMCSRIANSPYLLRTERIDHYTAFPSSLRSQIISRCGKN